MALVTCESRIVVLDHLGGLEVMAMSFEDFMKIGDDFIRMCSKVEQWEWRSSKVSDGVSYVVYVDVGLGGVSEMY